MKKKNKKTISLTAIIFFIVAFLFLAIGLGTLGSVSGTGKAYELRRRGENDGKEPSVFFVLQNPSYVNKEGKTVTDYYRLTNVYLNIGAIYNNDTESAEITLSRGASATANAYSYRAEVGNVAYVPKHEVDKDGKEVEDKTVLNAVGNWVEPFDLSVTDPSNLRVASYKYYQLKANTCNMLINEIVFYGEKLTSASGDGTGEYGIIPVEIEAAAPVMGENNDDAEKRAYAAIDAQQKPVIAQSSFFRLGKEETYSMLTVSEMRMGNVVYTTSGGANANVYNGDRVYNALGSSILALGVVIFGNSPFGLRFFPMLASFGILVMGYLFVKQLCRSEKAGLVFAVLYALSGFTLALGHLGTPLTIGLFFFVCALYFVYSFYNKGIKKVGTLGVMPLFLGGAFGAAAICVNGVYAIASLALAGLFAAGMVRQMKARRVALDEAIAAAEAVELQEGEYQPVFDEDGNELPREINEETKRVIAVAEEYRWKNSAAPAAFFTALVIGAMIMSLIFVLPGYVAYVKLFDNVASPRLNVFGIMAQLFAGGFKNLNGGLVAFHPFYKTFVGMGGTYAVTAVVCNTVALIAGLLGVAYAVYKIVLVCTKKLEGRDARVALRRAVIPAGLIVAGAVCASFGGGALAFIALVYIGLFMLAAECARDLTENEGKLQKAAKIITWVVFGLLCAVFILYAVFTFSIPLSASFIGMFA